MKLNLRITIFIVLNLMNFINSNACTCTGNRTIKEAFNQTPIILHGKVKNLNYVELEETINPKLISRLKENIKNDDHKLNWLNTKYIIKAQIEIIYQYKGNILNNETIIYTTRTGASCGFTYFEIGDEYLIYAYPKSDIYHLIESPDKFNMDKLEKENTYWTNSCTRTNHLQIYEKLELDKICDN